MIGDELQHLIQSLSRLPGLGPRSARRAVLTLVKKRETMLDPLIRALADVQEKVTVCPDCGNVDTICPCAICSDPKRDPSLLCVVQDVTDLWALERTHAFKGRYHVLGGLLSALDGVGPEDLGIGRLMDRVSDGVTEVIMALPATVDGQTTAHYIVDGIQEAAPNVTVSGIAHGVPVGGELDYLDEGTLQTALTARRGF